MTISFPSRSRGSHPWKKDLLVARCPYSTIRLLADKSLHRNAKISILSSIAKDWNDVSDKDCVIWSERFFCRREKIHLSFLPSHQIHFVLECTNEVFRWRYVQWYRFPRAFDRVRSRLSLDWEYLDRPMPDEARSDRENLYHESSAVGNYSTLESNDQLEKRTRISKGNRSSLGRT